MAASALDIESQIKYWQRNLKTVLPTEYTATDSSRCMLGFLILAALDLLGVGVETLPASDVKGFRTWILNCQHPNGGFCGSPNHKYPKTYYTEDARSDIDPANLAATFFAIIVLSFVGRLSDMDRGRCLNWLKKLQREDGSFGEMLGENGEVEGGSDVRYSFFAAGVRWMLRGDIEQVNEEEFEDIDVDALVRYIRSAETYEGGFAENPGNEAHAGYTYNSIAALSFLGRLPASVSRHNILKSNPGEQDTGQRGFENLQGTVWWLLSREVVFPDQEDAKDASEQGFSQTSEERFVHALDNEFSHNITTPPRSKEVSITDMPSLATLSLEDRQYVGFNGRLNKLVDTCYCFWVSASLEILGQGKLIDLESARRYLIGQAQHKIGGFAKQPGDLPDLYHSYLGLAALAMMKEPGLKEVDPVLCVSVRAREKLENSIREATTPVKIYWKYGTPFMSLESDPHHAQRMEEDEGLPQYLVDRLKNQVSAQLR